MQKLELTWIGKGKEPLLEPRILIHDKEKSYGDENTENMLIHGDNLLALKSLEQDYTGQIKCIYIDPPYNIGVANPNYDDNVPHSEWLSLIAERIKILYRLLSNKGLLWISIDDDECHYLKVVCDEIFGRNNFVSDITYERSGSAGLGQGGLFVNTTEHILVYKKEELCVNNVLGTEELELKTMKRYNKVLVNEGERELVEEFLAPSNRLPVKIYKHTNFEIETISLRSPQTRMREINEEFVSKFDRIFRTNNVQKENEFQNKLLSKMDKKFLYTVDYTPSRGKYAGKETTLYYYNAELFAWLKDTAFIENGKVVKTSKLTTVWKHGDIPKADLANEGGVEFPRSKKPEQLIKRILEISTNEGDIVLDSFLGSGTTAAVAHKMGRKWIGIELGDHCYTHCKPRLERVIDGEDKGGITKSVNWKGGGGFKFYELAPSLLKKDFLGQYVIDREKYDDEKLAMAVAKINGYKYAPDSECFFKQGKSTEQSYIFTTTNYVTAEYLSMIANELKENEYLLLCCSAYDVGLADKYDNIYLKKIPLSVLDKCEFGKDNYNLNIVDWDDFEFEVEEDEEE